MAHECFSCGGECYCNGDIDDCIVSLTPAKCESCGCEEGTDDYSDDDDWDDDDGDDTYDPAEDFAYLTDEELEE
ncbi:hypothetical protein [uncultured Fibrella sp.]|uniref:hypothetical protein n=1 Tax=uncultured Fibrella sp. TaxID=1284596 RepID=UPI0035CB59E7